MNRFVGISIAACIATLPVIALAQNSLSITQSSPRTVNPGGTLTYTFTVTNQSSGLLYDLRINNPYSSEYGKLTFDPGNSDPTCIDDGDIDCNISVIGLDQPKSVMISFTVAEDARCGAQLRNWATVSGDTVSTIESSTATVSIVCPNNSNPQPVPPPSRKIPPAGYEDEVLVNFEAYNNPFPDTDMDTLPGKAAAELYRRAVIGGFPDGEFKGNRPVNRAEAAKFLLLARFASIEDISNSGRFPDVLDGQWYTKFVVTAANKGIIGGYPDGLFRPANQVNTAEFLKMLSLTFDLRLDMDYSYSDVPSDAWFAQYAGIAAHYKLFPGRSSRLSPESPLSRQDVAIAIYQYLSNR